MIDHSVCSIESVPIDNIYFLGIENFDVYFYPSRELPANRKHRHLQHVNILTMFRGHVHSVRCRVATKVLTRACDLRIEINVLRGTDLRTVTFVE